MDNQNQQVAGTLEAGKKEAVRASIKASLMVLQSNRLGWLALSSDTATVIDEKKTKLFDIRKQADALKEELSDNIRDYLEENTDILVEIANENGESIYPMDDFDELMDGMTPTDIAEKIYYGDGFNPNDDYFMFDGCANLKSLTDFSVTDEIDIDDIVSTIIDEDSSDYNDIQDFLDGYNETMDELTDKEDDMNAEIAELQEKQDVYNKSLNNIQNEIEELETQFKNA